MISDIKITLFESLRRTNSGSLTTIGEAIWNIKTGKYKDQINKIRQGQKDIKKNIPAIAFHGIFENERKKDKFIESSGLIILDIDHVDVSKIEEIKEDIFYESNSVYAVMTSPSGDGIKVLYYVEPDIVDVNTYRPIGKKLVDNFSHYGDVDYLSITDCLIFTYDPKMLVREDPEPDFVSVDVKVSSDTSNLEELDKTKTLWEDAEEFFETVLINEILDRASNNFHFIQMSVFELAKFGFKHPNQDLEFIIAFSEEHFGGSGKNALRFKESVEKAEMIKQKKHPYKTIKETKDYIDLDMLQVENTKEELEDLTNTGLIDYSNIFEDVLSVIEEGSRVGFETSFTEFNECFRAKGHGVCVVTGIPTHGKTEAVDAITVDYARLHGHSTMVVGWEQTPKEHIVKLMRKVQGQDIRNKNSNVKLERMRELCDFVTHYFKHIDLDRIGSNIENIIKKLDLDIDRERSLGKDVKYVVIDPYNMINVKGTASPTEKAEIIMRALTQFSKKKDVLVFLVAHPTKMQKDEKTGEYKVPDFYSVKGSSAFFEMAYHGIVVYRMPNGSTMLRILKVKQNNMGRKDSECYFDYDVPSGRYIPIDMEGAELEGDYFDRDWLEKSFLKAS